MVLNKYIVQRTEKEYQEITKENSSHTGRPRPYCIGATCTCDSGCGVIAWRIGVLCPPSIPFFANSTNSVEGCSTSWFLCHTAGSWLPPRLGRALWLYLVRHHLLFLRTPIKQSIMYHLVALAYNPSCSSLKMRFVAVPWWWYSLLASVLCFFVLRCQMWHNLTAPLVETQRSLSLGSLQESRLFSR